MVELTDNVVPHPVAEKRDLKQQEEREFVLDLDGYDGPLDVLLDLARKQQVDLGKISILQLVDQYTDFIEHARVLDLELAAEFLVMAAWLALLKSRLLLPQPEITEPSADEIAARLAFRLQKLHAMRTVAERLMNGDRLGITFFARGCPEDVITVSSSGVSASVLDLMQAYARIRSRDDFLPYKIQKESILTVEEAQEYLQRLIGDTVEWSDLMRFLPSSWLEDEQKKRSAIASTFAASLELVKSGLLEIRQKGSFAPIQIMRRTATHGN